jgi:pimeloyl-ACP methyl ester carboxylesterase
MDAPTPNHALVVASPLPSSAASRDTAPSRWALYLHGILGSGPNWRTIARRFVQARPAWGVVLVDLRLHGGSQGFPPPHDVQAAADDLVALEALVPGPIAGILGHSFGGKVALAHAARHGARLGLERLWLIDSNPGARPDARGSEGTLRVLDMLRALPPRFPTRQAFVDAVLAAGHDLPIAQWLAMNLEREGDELRFGLDLDGIGALLSDYFARDHWRVLEAPPASMRVVVVNGARSNVYDDADRARAAALAAEGLIEHHEIPGAGHWVHADAPDDLVRILVESTP